MSIDARRTLRELAIEIPGATHVFEQFGMDYCCGGRQSLEEACTSRGVGPDEVTRSLEEARQSRESSENYRDWEADSLKELISHVVDKHHVFTRNQLDHLEPLLSKVSSVHGDNHPELRRVQPLFDSLKQEMTSHMMKEEQVLFPYIQDLEAASLNGGSPPEPFFGTVVNPIRMMIAEHDTAGELLQQIREITRDFEVPPAACTSYFTLYREFEALEADLHQHIHLENNLLFPRATELETRLTG